MIYLRQKGIPTPIVADNGGITDSGGSITDPKMKWEGEMRKLAEHPPASGSYFGPRIY
jgi:hypothetical protein